MLIGVPLPIEEQGLFASPVKAFPAAGDGLFP
ncbi:hypothetical protein SBA3_450026 [Candidatus Sulfopaludibacter sp. SbA3]|nr:hypothetical protein SBA3_450026 [Candidatus Sulfopaludibacter sp. SbA3]